jgi:hypothetical protein
MEKLPGLTSWEAGPMTNPFTGPTIAEAAWLLNVAIELERCFASPVITRGYSLTQLRLFRNHGRSKSEKTYQCSLRPHIPKC